MGSIGPVGPIDPIGQSNAGSLAASGSRLLFVDNLRTLMIVMVILVHLSITYGGAGSWCYKEVDRPDALTFSVLSIQNATFQSFFMGLLCSWPQATSCPAPMIARAPGSFCGTVCCGSAFPCCATTTSSTCF